jgi:metal-responsive CopG/Arc/MetJ family transcriptional regulator
MANIKTAISMEEPLFKEIEALAEDLEVSRSHLFALAAREFIKRHKSQKLLDALNDAYDDLPDPSEKVLHAQKRAKHRELVKDQW